MKWFIIAGIILIALLSLIFLTQRTSYNEVCLSDADCMPAKCCHPTSCVPLAQQPDCAGVFCTQECVPGTLDCGQGRCVCKQGSCGVRWTNASI